jgi:hypothetical protein
MEPSPSEMTGLKRHRNAAGGLIGTGGCSLVPPVRFVQSPSHTKEIGNGTYASPGSDKFRLNRGICKRRDTLMMDLKSGQYKKIRYDEANPLKAVRQIAV